MSWIILRKSVKNNLSGLLLLLTYIFNHEKLYSILSLNFNFILQCTLSKKYPQVQLTGLYRGVAFLCQ